MKIKVGWVYGDKTFTNDEATDENAFDTLFTSEVTLLVDDGLFGFGKLKILRISCSCYNTLNYFLPI